MKRARTEQAKDERRQLLLDVALDEFFERGFAAARMDDIANRANLSKGTLYLYFSSKEELFSEIIKAVALPKLAQLEALSVEANSLDDALDAIGAFAPKVVQFSNLPKLAKVLIGECNNFPEIVQAYRENVLDKIFASISAVLRRAQENGEIDIDDPDLLAKLVFAPVMFSGLWHVSFGVQKEAMFDVEALIQMHINILKRALKPSAG